MLVAGNWKMHGSQAMVRGILPVLAAELRSVELDVVVCPPFPYLSMVVECASGSVVAVGAQDLHPAASGAHTGEVSGQMLRDVGCEWVIIGHSERRADSGETDAIVARKVNAALDVGLTPIVCVGETREQRESGRTFDVVATQLASVLECAGPERLRSLVLAYEPVWAIGTGLTASPEQAQEVHLRVRQQVEAFAPGAESAMRVVYGGSVKAANASALFAMPDIDGGLIGGASLDAGEFAAICRAAEGRPWNK
jgi:triosephosphate isomerase